MATSSEINNTAPPEKVTPKDVALGLGGLFAISAALTAGSWFGMAAAGFVVEKVMNYVVNRGEKNEDGK